MPILGCIADDFTGASDAASFLVKGGMSVQLFNGIPDGDAKLAPGIQALVIALKSRTQKTEEAIEDSIEALKWLKEKGSRQFYLKYCSTFDSTPKGNIGPVADAMMQFLKVPYTILCPALPVNGRVVRNGNLYVNGVELQDSPMKNHPLTPMWDCRIAELMKPQSQYPCIELWKEHMQQSDEKIKILLDDQGRRDEHFYIIPDYLETEDGERIVTLFGDLPLLTGGSGVLEPLARHWSSLHKQSDLPDVRVKGPAILLAGSCSKATLEQIDYFNSQGGLSYKIDPIAMLEGRQTLEDAWKAVEENPGKSILIYSSDTAENVKKVQHFGRMQIAEMLEQTAAALAERAVSHGIYRIIVAGGETSGAVTKRLGFSSYQIGASVAPGVPVMIPMENPNVRLVLKSGNFGQREFFEQVLTMTQMEE